MDPQQKACQSMLSQICYKAEKKILQIKKLALYLQCLYDIGRVPVK